MQSYLKYTSPEVEKPSIQKYLPADELNIMRFDKGHAIYHQDNYPCGLHIIISGKVKICMSGDGGKEQIIRIAVKDDCLGLECLVKYCGYNSSAIALSDTETSFVSKNQLGYLMQTNLELSNAFVALLSTNIIERDRKLTGISYTPVRGRLADALLLLDKTFNRDASGSITLTRNELASYIGSVKETTTRALSEFKNEKLVEIDDKGIKIINYNKLLSVRNLYR